MTFQARKRPGGDQPRKGTRAAPKFTHLPAQRAKKLKEEWIIKQRIKNAYRAQKRRGEESSGKPAFPNLDRSSPSEAVMEEGLAVEDNNSGDDAENDDSESESSVAGPSRGQNRRSHSPPAREPVSNASHPSKSKDKGPLGAQTKASQSSKPTRPSGRNNSRPHTLHKRNHASQSRQAGSGGDADAESARIRELVKEAYSPSSLHTFKSDPLKKRGNRDASSTSNRGRGGGRGGRGGTTGRGQPDMRKRMGALLAQIEANTGGHSRSS
ncbi:hypothetical protein DL93DRAFT_2099797 [Clavulina sp. PMI_390]|nr:hypothetical protein DL93DRAFT_2099797 [Clavulina sp. PMI_390]